MCFPRIRPSSPAQAGDPVRREFSIPSLAPRNTGSSGPSAQLRIRPDDDDHGHSRDGIRPSFANSSAPKKQRAQATLKRGRREDRVRAAPVVSRANAYAKKNAHEHTGSAEAVRPSLRNGFTAYIVLSPARPGLLVTVAPKKRELPKNLTPANWGVRTTRLCRPLKRCSSIASLRPPHPAPTSVTIAIRPSSRARDGNK